MIRDTWAELMKFVGVFLPGKNKCGYGHVWGVDYTQFPEDCHICPDSYRCAKAWKRLKDG